MNATIPAPANLEDSYRLYLAALRETGAPVTVGTAIVADRCKATAIPWAFVGRPDRRRYGARPAGIRTTVTG